MKTIKSVFIARQSNSNKLTMMKNLCLLFFFASFFSAKLSAQVMHNRWINYSKTYYKFKIGPFGYDYLGYPVNSGAVRISQSTLSAAGLGGVPAEQLQLWHNGQEVQMYITKASGTLGASDYVEFYGEIPDGNLDSELYSTPSFQLSKHWSLESDSSAYFLTVNPSGGNKRLITVTNNASTASIKPEKNFMYTIGYYARDMLNPGFGSTVAQGSSSFTLYSSSYSVGEGFSSFLSGGGISWVEPGIFVDTSGPAMTAKFVLAGVALNARNVGIYLNNDSIAQLTDNFYNAASQVVTGIDPHIIANDTADFFYQDITSSQNDNFVIAQTELVYPRQFNFGGQSNFEFYLLASDTGRFIKIANFSTNGVAPVLYDLANGNRYAGDVVGDSVLFLLQPSAQQYHLALVRGDGSAANIPASFETRKFTNFSTTANQGNYLIITNSLLYGSGSSNYVSQYAAYRSSAAGGGFKAKVVDIEDIEDQFAYGVKRHPLAIKDFLQFARNTFSIAPAYAFLIGKGIDYTQYRLDETDPLVYATALVPTFGDPGSDNLLGSPDFNPVTGTPIGRLSAVSPQEVGVYLAKIKQYEAAQQDTSQTPAAKGWMKNVLQLTGADDPSIGQILDQYMAGYTSIIADTSFGANVTTYSKSANPATYPQAVSNFANIFNGGSSIVNYFGHSSSTNLDFNLTNPLDYNNKGKYPVFIVNGCLAGNIFDYDPARLTNLATISERFMLTPQDGAIGFLATSSYGITNYLDIYTTQFYKSIGVNDYGKGFGLIAQHSINAGFTITGPSDFYGRIHAEQFTFHGDPALKINTFSKPDYSVVASNITVSPSFVSVADDSFSVKVVVYNLGKATSDSVHFSLYRRLPNGDSSVVFTKEFKTLVYSDSVTLNLPLVADRDKGSVVLTAVIDDNRAINEITYSNNTARISVPVSSAEIRPIYPFNYAVVASDSVTLAASTANPLDTVKQYVMQMDTTVLFNSGMEKTFNQTSSGGVLQFKNVALTLNNTVYYWRIAIAGANQHWNMFSFVHRSGGNAGLEQAHYYQHTQSSFNNIVLDSARTYDFLHSPVNLFVKQAVYPYGGTEDADFSVAVNGTLVAQSACVGSSIIFNVFDPVTFSIFLNTSDTIGAAPVCLPTRAADFEYAVTDPVSRDSAVSFMDHFVQNGQYVVVRNIYNGEGVFGPDWEADTAIYGHNNSLYNRLLDQGVPINQYTYGRCFIFVYRKNDSASFAPVAVYSQGLYDAITLSQNISVIDTLGYVTSPVFGPANKWNSVSWQGVNLNNNNLTSLNIIGIDKSNKDTVLYTIDKSKATQDISAINASTYPYIQLQMRTQDSLTAQPYQLKDWSVGYVPVPEGGVAPNLGVSLPDTVKVLHSVNTQPDTLQGYVLFKNVSVSNFDSLKIELTLTDTSGKVDTFPVARTKALVAGDTVRVGFLANVTSLPQGQYNLFLYINAGNDQPEQYLFNNSLYKYVFIQRSTVFPVTLLDFTGTPDGKAVLLNWKVTNELDFNYYGVEHSTDGRNFSQMGTVPAQNDNTTSVKDYSFVDNNPAAGENFYRLRLVDKDGAVNYSKVITVYFDENEEVQVFPNPFGSRLNVSVKGGGTGGNIVRVLDLSGRSLMEKPFTGGNITLDVSGLASGTYLVQVNNGNSMQTFKVQKYAQ